MLDHRPRPTERHAGAAPRRPGVDATLAERTRRLLVRRGTVQGRSENQKDDNPGYLCFSNRHTSPSSGSISSMTCVKPHFRNTRCEAIESGSVWAVARSRATNP
jgi:hypothetical protein